MLRCQDTKAQEVFSEDLVLSHLKLFRESTGNQAKILFKTERRAERKNTLKKYSPRNSQYGVARPLVVV